MRTAAIALALALLPVPLVAQQQDMVGATDPIALIEQVCLGDQVRLSPGTFGAISYAELPSKVRQALGFGVPQGPIPQITPTFEHDAKEVANQFFEVLPGKDAYLMLPAAVGSAGATAESCAVIWHGTHYDDALAGMRRVTEIPDGAQSAIKSTGIPGFNFATVRSNGLIVGAAEFAGWTLLRVAPDTAPSE
jgi:hypothetical protein